MHALIHRSMSSATAAAAAAAVSDGIEMELRGDATNGLTSSRQLSVTSLSSRPSITEL